MHVLFFGPDAIHEHWLGSANEESFSPCQQFAMDPIKVQFAWLCVNDGEPCQIPLRNQVWLHWAVYQDPGAWASHGWSSGAGFLLSVWLWIHGCSHWGSCGCPGAFSHESRRCAPGACEQWMWERQDGSLLHLLGLLSWRWGNPCLSPLGWNFPSLDRLLVEEGQDWGYLFY